MGFKIDQFLENEKGTNLADKITGVHDNLYAAYKVIESVGAANNLAARPSDDVLIAVFSKLKLLRAYNPLLA